MSYRSLAMIIYVTEIEKQAVMRMYDWSDLTIEGDDQAYMEAFVERDGRRLRIISAQQDEMGMTASAALTIGENPETPYADGKLRIASGWTLHYGTSTPPSESIDAGTYDPWDTYVQRYMSVTKPTT